MGKQADGGNNNVILFPGLVPRLVKKGMESLKEKRYYDALTYFKQSSELEPEHPQARYGLVITNIELNQLPEAKKYCESMLREGIGDYYEVLQVYVSLLVQLGKYDEVVELLDGLLSEDKIPRQLLTSYEQLLEFSRNMVEGDRSDLPETLTGLHDYSYKDDYESESADFTQTKEDLIKILEKGKPDQQWGAIQKLSHLDSAEVEKAYREFLKEKENHPVLKSYVLQMLKEMKYTGRYHIHKFGEDFEVVIEEMEEVFHQAFGTTVVRRLEKELAQTNPSLFEMVQQVWWHYLFAIYPKRPEGMDQEIWACALHHMGDHLLSGDGEIKDIIHLYEADEKDVKAAADHLKEVESLIFSIEHPST